MCCVITCVVSSVVMGCLKNSHVGLVSSLFRIRYFSLVSYTFFCWGIFFIVLGSILVRFKFVLGFILVWFKFKLSFVIYIYI